LPFTAATTGRGIKNTRISTRSNTSRKRVISAGSAAFSVARSRPAQKCRPSPVKTNAFGARCSTSFSAWSSAWMNAGFIAFALPSFMRRIAIGP
jgi:hypothetical protein